MTTSTAGRTLIESFEGFSAEAYLPTPEDVPTIGYGHTNGVKMGDECTQEQADAYMQEDLRVAERAVNGKVTVPLNQNQFDALVSLTYNIGAGNFDTSTLLRLLNSGDTPGAAAQFLVWNKQAGKVMQGLINRRTAEQALFLTAV